MMGSCPILFHCKPALPLPGREKQVLVLWYSGTVVQWYSGPQLCPRNGGKGGLNECLPMKEVLDSIWVCREGGMWMGP